MKVTKEVIAKISEITTNQPGLMNGFAKQLVERYPEKKTLTLKEYEVIEEWYLTEAIDKNVANILKIAEQHKPFLKRLLFKEEEIPFEIDRPVTKILHVNGLITYNTNNKIVFWVPLYRKRLAWRFLLMRISSSGDARRT